MIFFELAFVIVAFLALGFALGRQCGLSRGRREGYAQGRRDEAALYVQENHRARRSSRGRS